MNKDEFDNHDCHKGEEDGCDCDNVEIEEDEEVCLMCGGDGFIEILGDGDNFEVDVIGHRPCPDCNNNDND